jgi:hypothetical protein
MESSRPMQIAAALILLMAPAAEAQSRLRTVAFPNRTGAQQGVGILRPRRTGECFVVTPRHVANPDDPTVSRVAGPSGVLDSIVSAPDRYSSDLAVWRLARRVDRTQCPAWPSVGAVNRALLRADERGTEGEIAPRTVDGAGKPVRVRISQVTLTQFTVRPEAGGFAQGMSGSPVSVGGVVVGVLTAVEEDDYGRAVGTVMRLDYLEDHVGRFFNPAPAPGSMWINASLVFPGAGQVHTRRRAAGMLWTAAGAGPSLYMFLRTGEERIPRTRLLPDGREETYYETRPVHPQREVSWIPWVLAGMGSFLEARSHAARYYIPPERSGEGARRSARLRLSPGVQPRAQGTRVQLAEIRF